MTKNEAMFCLMERFPRIREEKFYNFFKDYLNKWSKKKTVEVVFVVLKLSASVWFGTPEIFTVAEREILLSERKLFDGLANDERFIESVGDRKLYFLPDMED